MSIVAQLLPIYFRKNIKFSINESGNHVLKVENVCDNIEFSFFTQDLFKFIEFIKMTKQTTVVMNYESYFNFSTPIFYLENLIFTNSLKILEKIKPYRLVILDSNFCKVLIKTKYAQKLWIEKSHDYFISKNFENFYKGHVFKTFYYYEMERLTFSIIKHSGNSSDLYETLKNGRFLTFSSEIIYLDNDVIPLNKFIDSECGICYEKIDRCQNLTVLKCCKNIMCFDCLSQLTTDKCPYCRNFLPNILNLIFDNILKKKENILKKSIVINKLKILILTDVNFSHVPTTVYNISKKYDGIFFSTIKKELSIDKLEHIDYIIVINISKHAREKSLDALQKRYKNAKIFSLEINLKK